MSSEAVSGSRAIASRAAVNCQSRTESASGPPTAGSKAMRRTGTRVLSSQRLCMLFCSAVVGRGTTMSTASFWMIFCQSLRHGHMYCASLRQYPHQNVQMQSLHVLSSCHRLAREALDPAACICELLAACTGHMLSQGDKLKASALGVACMSSCGNCLLLHVAHACCLLSATAPADFLHSVLKLPRWTVIADRFAKLAMSIPADQVQAQPLQQRPAAALQGQPQDVRNQGLRQVAPSDVCRLGSLHLLPGDRGLCWLELITIRRPHWLMPAHQASQELLNAAMPVNCSADDQMNCERFVYSLVSETTTARPARRRRRGRCTGRTAIG